MGAKAERVIQSSKVFTGLDDGPRPLAIGIARGRIVWIAPPADVGTVEHPITDTARREDLGDAFLMPGFHDAHMHLFHSALYSSPLAEQFVGTSEADCVERMVRMAQRRKEGWLLSQGWREYLWDEPSMPSKHSLDEAFPDRSVALYSGDAHTLWLNSKALAELGIDEKSIPPVGGSYDKDDEGHLTGIVREVAAMELMPHIMATFSEEELLNAYTAFIKSLNALGITSLCDMALSATPGIDFVRDDLLEKLEAAGQLSVRVHMFPTLLPETPRLHRMQEAHQGPLLRGCGYKQFLDGVSSQHTAWLHDPYANARFSEDRGRPSVDVEALGTWVSEAVGKGDGVRIHAIGDEAIHQALQIYARAQAFAGEQATDERCMLTLEHLENFRRDDRSKLAEQHIIASVQPRHITLDPGGPERDLGPERVVYMWPLRSLLDEGTILAFGTDSPVTPPDPLAVIYTAITRKDAVSHEPEGGWQPQERITVAEALRAYTAGSAQAAARSHELGVLDVGMLADMVAFDRDLTAIEPKDVLSARVLATYLGGEKVYGAPSVSPA